MEPQQVTDTLPAIVFAIGCLIAAVVLTFVIRRQIKRNKDMDSR